MSESLWVGEIFAGKYRVEKILGQGGMGMVLGARHLGLDEAVAIKVLLPAMLEIPGMVERFVREARAAAKIESEHVVRVRDVDTLPSGVPFMVMERLTGADLATLCKDRGPLEIDESVRYLLETCEAIAEAHAHGIVHRDLKPANLFLARRRDGSALVKVLDFGISKVMQSDGEHQVTAPGTVLGSPSYMSPEQLRAAQDVDGRTDIWALGAVLYRLVTGMPPFPGEILAQVCTQVVGSPPRSPSALRPDLPPGLEAVILRCLEKHRAQRFATAGELAAALLPFADTDARKDAMRWIGEDQQLTIPVPSAVQAQSFRDTVDGTVTPVRITPRRSTSWAAPAAIAGVVVVGSVIGGLVLRSSHSQPEVASAALPADPLPAVQASAEAGGRGAAPEPPPTVSPASTPSNAAPAASPPPPKKLAPSISAKPAAPLTPANPFQGRK